jgi:hypothetical protein
MGVPFEDTRHFQERSQFMECSACGVRSAVGYCVKCQAMLCEECGIACETCGKVVCSEHMQETRSGRQLCVACYEERRHGRKGQGDHGAAEGTAFETLKAEGAEPGGEEGSEGEILTASAYRSIPPWKLSLGVAITAVVLALIILLFPGMRRVTLSGTTYIPTPYLLLILPALSIAWAALGLVRSEYWEDRPKCLIGPVVSLVCIALCIVAAVTDPAKEADRAAQELQQEREGMTKEQLEVWREQRLQRYDRGQTR